MDNFACNFLTNVEWNTGPDCTGDSKKLILKMQRIKYFFLDYFLFVFFSKICIIKGADLHVLKHTGSK